MQWMLSSVIEDIHRKIRASGVVQSNPVQELQPQQAMPDAKELEIRTALEAEKAVHEAEENLREAKKALQDAQRRLLSGRRHDKQSV
jgi:hypothetical protein